VSDNEKLLGNPSDRVAVPQPRIARDAPKRPPTYPALHASNRGVIARPGRMLGCRPARVGSYPAAASITPAVTIAWAMGAPPVPSVPNPHPIS
jgi:hypothetical protein